MLALRLLPSLSFRCWRSSGTFPVDDAGLGARPRVAPSLQARAARRGSIGATQADVCCWPARAGLLQVGSGELAAGAPGLVALFRPAPFCPPPSRRTGLSCAPPLPPPSRPLARRGANGGNPRLVRVRCEEVVSAPPACVWDLCLWGGHVVAPGIVACPAEPSPTLCRVGVRTCVRRRGRYA